MSITTLIKNIEKINTICVFYVNTFSFNKVIAMLSKNTHTDRKYLDKNLQKPEVQIAHSSDSLGKYIFKFYRKKALQKVTVLSSICLKTARSRSRS